MLNFVRNCQTQASRSYSAKGRETYWQLKGSSGLGAAYKIQSQKIALAKSPAYRLTMYLDVAGFTLELFE